jgi:C-terminal processing protease CtpA/Prc
MAAGCLAIGVLGGVVGACRREEPSLPVQVIQPFPERYSGVGLELKTEAGLPVVVRTIRGGAAEQAGILPGDVLVEIEGVSTRGWDLADVIAALRGGRGSSVFVSARRDGGGSKEVLRLRRGELARSPAFDGGVDGRSYFTQ